MPQQSLEELLIKTKLISPPQLAVAQRDAEVTKKKLAEAVIELGFVGDRQFAEWLSGATNIPIVDPLRAEVVADIEGHVPANVARQYQVVPIDVDADAMTIATIDPLDRTSIDAIHEATGMKIHPVIGIRGQLAAMVKKIYPEKKPFDPSATVAIPIEQEAEPFAFGDETMLRRHSLEYAYTEGDVSLGSETRVLPGPPTTVTTQEEDTNPVTEAKSETQLDRIERHLVDVTRSLDLLQRRVDAIDATLARIVNRK